MQNTGIEFQIVKGIKEERHFHSETELLFVIEGEGKAILKDSVCELGKDDVIVVNPGIMHSVVCSERTVICSVHFLYQLLPGNENSTESLFVCNSVSENGISYKELREIIYELVYCYVQNQHKTECLKMSILYKLLDCLIENYQMDGSVVHLKMDADDVRMQRILQYVNLNFQYSITLSELADKLYVSTSTLSRLFKKRSGMYFADYLNQVRIGHAVQEMLESDYNITKIAVDAGFSNPSVFNRVFRERYKMPPSDYRKQQKERIRTEKAKEQMEEEKLRQELKKKEIFLTRRDMQEKLTEYIDVSNGDVYKKTWDQAVNIGSVYNLTLANLQYHTLYLTEHLGFQYIRLWNVFSKKLMISDGSRRGNYNYDTIDGVLDFLVSHHIRLYLDFGKRPNTAVKSEGESIFFEEEYIHFVSREAWESLLADFMQHIVKRYGEEEVSQWMFELSSDRIHLKESNCYDDVNYDYFNAYKYMYRTIKRLVPGALTGGPLGIIDWAEEFLREFLERSREEGCEPDFVSAMLFPYETKSDKGVITHRRAADEMHEAGQIRRLKKIIKDMGMEGCRIFIAEWNNTLSNRNYLNDSCFRAAYIARTLSQIWDSVDMMSVWMGSDWVSSYYDTVGVANGGSGLLTKDSIRKPAYFALEFMNRLGNCLIQRGEHYIITRNEKQSYYILCYNFKYYSYQYFLQEESVSSPDKINDIFEDTEQADIRMVLYNMPPNTRFIIKKRTISMEEGSILNEWKKLQYDRNMESSEVKYIRDVCFPHMSLEKQQVNQGKISIRTVLQPHEISLFHIYEDTV